MGVKRKRKNKEKNEEVTDYTGKKLRMWEYEQPDELHESFTDVLPN